MKPRRQVTIKLETSAPGAQFYAVEYTERRRNCRHWAAQFDARHSTLAEVRDWIAGKPELELISVDKS